MRVPFPLALVVAGGLGLILGMVLLGLFAFFRGRALARDEAARRHAAAAALRVARAQMDADARGLAARRDLPTVPLSLIGHHDRRHHH